MHANCSERPKTCKGFTLIELSIVIVIIGLIVAGVVRGQAIVQQAKLRSLITDVEKIKTAIRTFKLEYNALPGDIGNASSFWAGVPNGNEDKIIAPHGSIEAEYFWVHLSRAGLYAGEFSGSRTNPPVIGYEIPEGPFSNTGYSIVRLHHPPAFGLRRTAVMLRNNWGNAVAASGTLTPKDAYAIDVKIDDGLAHNARHKGILSTARGYNIAGPDACTQGNLGYNSLGEQLYQLSDTSNNCWPFFWLEGVAY